MRARAARCRQAGRRRARVGRDLADRRRRRSPTTTSAQLALGQALAAAGDAAAFAPLERAAALVPIAIGDDSPHALMARLAEKLGDRAARDQGIRGAARHGSHRRRAGAQAAGAARRAGGRRARAAVALERVVALDPFDAAAHTGLGRLALKRQRSRRRDARVQRRARRPAPADKAAAHCDLGESYLLAGMQAEAKREALAALEIAPSFERAQELLLNAVEARQQPVAMREPARRAGSLGLLARSCSVAAVRRLARAARRRAVPPLPTPASPACSGPSSASATPPGRCRRGPGFSALRRAVVHRRAGGGAEPLAPRAHRHRHPGQRSRSSSTLEDPELCATIRGSTSSSRATCA